MANKLSRGSDSEIFSIIPAGTILPFGGDTAPAGWAICDGSTIVRATYPQLFTAIDVAHGEGDGSTTFHLPDLRGRFMRGVDNTTGNDPDAGTRTAANTGGNIGDAVGSLQDDETKPHDHLSVDTGPTDDVAVRTNVGDGGDWGSIYLGGNDFLYANDARTSNSLGSESRPKNTNVNYIIRLGNPI